MPLLQVRPTHRSSRPSSPDMLLFNRLTKGPLFRFSGPPKYVIMKKVTTLGYEAGSTTERKKQILT